MPLDAETQKAISDAVAAAFAPDKLAPLLAPVIKAHVDAAAQAAPKGLSQADLDVALAKMKSADDDAGKGAPKGKDGQPDPAVVALQKQLDAQRVQLETAERKATADANLFKVREALGKAGVAPERMHLAIAAVKESGALSLDGDKVGWKGKDAYGIDATLDFEAGAKLWASTNDGKTFLPAVEARGTGDGKNNRNGSNPGAITNLSDLRATIGADLLNSI